MKSRTTAQFRYLFANLPQQVQQQAREAYKQFKQDPWHPGLRFKQVHPREPIAVPNCMEYRPNKNSPFPSSVGE
ncbi:MAG: hypothetical protein V7K97_07645 [Nostoc sp.]|uniref:hypothetical protein n=1 Tax=Nostoc sp. TaxID=1180 RepID=UPI002FFABA6F